jgi:hypothetical protein
MDNAGPVSVEGLAVKHPVPMKDGYPTLDNQYNVATTFQIQCMFPNGVEVQIVDNSADGNGVLFEGTKGRFHVSRSRMKGKPVDDLEKNPIPEELITKLYKGKKPGNHMGNFFECIKTREQPISDVHTHHRAMTTCHLANIAIRLAGRSTGTTRPSRSSATRTRPLDPREQRKVSRRTRNATTTMRN